jgi:hypothetical protein
VPVVKLFIEGNLESEVLNPILQGSPVLQRGGSKYSLKPRAFAERRENQVAAGYLRDRDFDYDPPSDLSRPTVDSHDGGVPFGWRWCRHELENYLIDPAVVAEAMGWPMAEVEEALRQAARKVRCYEAARWTVGLVRRELPPNYELKTRPEELHKEIDLPSALDAAAVNAWASMSIENHRGRIVAMTDPVVVKGSLDAFATRFDDAFITDVSNILLWFSGKDVLAGMADWLIGRAVANPGAFRASLRDWIIVNPVRALELLPEWKGMIDTLRV